MKTMQELAERRDEIVAEQNELCKIDVWTSEQMDRYHELEDERIEIVDKLSDLRTIERLKDDNADLARLIDQMNRFCLDVSQVEELIAQNIKRIEKMRTSYEPIFRRGCNPSEPVSAQGRSRDERPF